MQVDIEHKMAIILVAFLVLFVGVAFAYNYYATISTHGSITTTINVETSVTDIDWGNIEPGQSTNLTIQVRTVGNTPVTLYVTASNWGPIAIEPYLALSSNATNLTIAPNEWVNIWLNLYVLDTIVGFTDFSFDITIEGIAT